MNTQMIKSRGLAVRDRAKSQVTKVGSSMSSKPMLWAGLAAGAGLGIGLIGRVAQMRSRQRRMLPDLIIIETGC